VTFDEHGYFITCCKLSRLHIRFSFEDEPGKICVLYDGASLLCCDPLKVGSL